jgi:cytidylate kinase
MRASVICISHAEGSGGQEIGRLVAERLGLRYVDDGIIGAAAEADKVYPEAVALAESRHAGRQIEVDFHRFEPTETLRGVIRDAIIATADEGNAVIVAHAASFALADRDNVLRVLVIASTENRLLRIRNRDGFDAKTAAKHVKESDKGRAAYLKHFYGVGEELPTHYDLVINTDKLPTEAAVQAIANAAA